METAAAGAPAAPIDAEPKARRASAAPVPVLSLPPGTASMSGGTRSRTASGAMVPPAVEAAPAAPSGAASQVEPRASADLGRGNGPSAAGTPVTGSASPSRPHTGSGRRRSITHGRSVAGVSGIPMEAEEMSAEKVAKQFEVRLAQLQEEILASLERERHAIENAKRMCSILSARSGMMESIATACAADSRRIDELTTKLQGAEAEAELARHREMNARKETEAREKELETLRRRAAQLGEHVATLRQALAEKSTQHSMSTRLERIGPQESPFQAWKAANNLEMAPETPPVHCLSTQQKRRLGHVADGDKDDVRRLVEGASGGMEPRSAPSTPYLHLGAETMRRPDTAPGTPVTLPPLQRRAGTTAATRSRRASPDGSPLPVYPRAEQGVLVLEHHPFFPAHLYGSGVRAAVRAPTYFTETAPVEDVSDDTVRRTVRAVTGALDAGGVDGVDRLMVQEEQEWMRAQIAITKSRLEKREQAIAAAKDGMVSPVADGKEPLPAPRKA